MITHLTREISAIQTRLLTLFGVVEQMISDATRALCFREFKLVPEVLSSDKRVDSEEVLIEEECLKVLAMYQPVAGDLRHIAAILKINSDLERIADLACNIAERAHGVQSYPYFPIPDQMPVMAQESTEMVRQALNAFVAQDLALAKKVILDDMVVDKLNRTIIQDLKKLMATDGELVEPAMHYISASRHYERIADHAENIAEDVVYMISGEIIRHKHGEFKIAAGANVTT
jgi:phosphate transport system protein